MYRKIFQCWAGEGLEEVSRVQITKSGRGCQFTNPFILLVQCKLTQKERYAYRSKGMPAFFLELALCYAALCICCFVYVLWLD